ncbi:MAG: cbb3-type cytochrome c oxidase N-terminal domain-containing protein [Fulvivirga sp.]|nr:cbb3-type cytochrome c oxidase N-terminal domain-containing protein [Fulvivirga sp.]
MKSKYKKALVFIMLLLSGLGVHAQDTFSSPQTFYIISGFMLVAAILVLIVAIIVLQVLRVFVNKELAQKAEATGEAAERKKSWWQKMLTKANDAVPVEKEEEILLDHNYDGIRELDNHLPPWWKWLFYATIIFSVVYLAAYHMLDTLPLQKEEYEMEVALAEEAKQARLANQPESTIDENNVEFVDDATALQDGKQVYNMNCAACHREDGGGGIGPNLTDAYWIHGGSIQDIFKTVKHGVPEKGMIAWEVMLSPEQMQNVSSYILTMQGSDPPNAKEPQGEIYNPEAGPKEAEEAAPVDEADTTAVASTN